MVSTHTFEHAFNVMPLASALISADGQITAMNVHFGALFGDDVCIGTPFSQLYADPLDAIATRWRRGTADVGDTALLLDARKVPFSTRLSRIPLEDGGWVVTVEPSRRYGAPAPGGAPSDEAPETGQAGAYRVDFSSREVTVTGMLERFFTSAPGQEAVPLSRWLAAIHPDDLARLRHTIMDGPDDPLAVISARCRMRAGAGDWQRTRHELRVVERAPDGAPLSIAGVVHNLDCDESAHRASGDLRDQLDTALDGLGLSTWEFDFDTLVGEISGPVNALLGAGPGPVQIGEAALRTRIHPDDAERVHAAFMGLQFGGRYDETFRLLSLQGHWVWYRSWGRMGGSSSEGARRSRAFGFWQQVPGQRAAVAVPPQSDIEGVLDRSGLSGWSYDFTTRQISLSGSVLTALGLPEGRDVMPIEEWRNRVHPSDLSTLEAGTQSLVETGTAQVEYRVRTEGGNWIWLSLRGGISAQTTDGEPLRASGVFLEATRRKEAELRLAASERLLSHAISSAALGAWELDYLGRRFLPHGEIRSVLDIEDTDDWVPVRNLLDLVHPEDRSVLDTTINAIMGDKPGRVHTVEYRMLDPRKGSHIWVEGRGSRLGPESERADCAGILLDISDRKALEASLAHSEERLARALENARQGTWQLDFRNETVTLSEIGRVIMGLPAESDGPISLAHWRSLIHPDDAHLCEAGVAGMVAGEPLNAIYRVGGGEGDCRWVEDRGAVTVRDENGEPVEAIGTLVDITRRRELELELAEREQRLSEAMDAGLSAIWSIDHETGEQSVRGKLLEWMGRDIGSDKVGLEDWNRIIHPDDRGIARKALAELMSGKPGGPVDYRLRFGDRWRWVRAKGEITARGKDGRPVRSGGVVVDITAEREFANALNVERERLSKIYRTTPVMMVTLSPAGEVMEVSEYWLKTQGFTREQVIGKPFQHFLTPSSVETLEAMGGMECLIAKGTIQDVLAHMVRADGEVIDILCSATVEYDADGRPVAAHGICVDVTTQRAQARDLERYAEELERTNRELDRFATIASHDLQEPLRKISAFASLIKRRHHGVLDHETDRSLDFLVDAAGRMRRLIDDLLTYSRASKRALESSPVDMGQITREIVAELDLLAEEARAEFTIAELPIIQGDRTLLRLLIQNLISNALKYRGDENVKIAISATRQNDVWQFSIRDNGIGLDPRFSEKIFAPFQRLHGREEYEGTGIGLAICQQAVERHGGRIWVEARPGEGACFYFTLPSDSAAARGVA